MHPRELRDPRRSPSFSSTNHRWNFFNDGNLQSFQPSPFALCQKPTLTQSRNPIRFPYKIRSHLGLHSGRLRSSPSLKGFRIISGPSHDFAMLGEKSVKCMHPKSRCSQNPQKWFILAGNDSDFRFSNLQSGFGRAWRNPWNDILCFKNITFAQPSLDEKIWTCPVVICQLSYKSGEAPKTCILSRDWHTPTCGSDCPVPGLNLAGSTGDCGKSFVKRWFFSSQESGHLHGGPIWPTNWYCLSQLFAGFLPSFP